ncbi:hypothetical protein [Rhizobium grahamii]|uniref:Uncharacterized protein n=1 Tax=Rhizobium grahamii CCGE 502 TaxID=990285 RepID=S3HHF8_9HYPH|nr:hypothetical protein [Rhizobium grahamii]EPE97530.1 hypothetical protein RGCCGE502_15845 [Rhizobium grahamii CCGE 502]
MNRISVHSRILSSSAYLAQNFERETLAAISSAGFRCKLVTPTSASHSCAGGFVTKPVTIRWNDGGNMVAGHAALDDSVLPTAN